MKLPANRGGRRAALIGLVAIGLSLRLLAVLFSPDHLDEPFTDQLARLPVGHLLDRLLATDTHPPLHYLTVSWAYDIFGPSRTALRLPSLVAGTLTLPVVWLAARPLGRDPLPVVATALVAVNTWHVVWSGLGRGYALMALFVTLAWAGFLRQSHDPGTPRWNWAALVVGAVGAAYVHNFGLLGTVAPMAAVVAWRRWRGDAPTPGGAWAGSAVAAIALLWAPWLVAFATQYGTAADALGWANLSLRGVVGTLRRPWSAYGWPWGYVWLDLLAPGLAAAGYRELRTRRGTAAAATLVVWWWWLPLAALALQPIRQVFIDRVFLGSVIPVSVLVAAGLVQLHRARPAAARLAGAAFVVAHLLGLAAVVSGQVRL